jgi:hypothetical protein
MTGTSPGTWGSDITWDSTAQAWVKVTGEGEEEG